MLKYEGWDGIVIEGSADKTVWVDICNDSVRIQDESSLWGLDTWKTQNEIWKEVSGKADFSDGFDAGGEGSGKRSTLEGLDLRYVADELEGKGRLGME